MAEISEYTEENIKTLEGVEHIRLRPGMYIGKLGDGSHSDDGIYVLVKEVIDTCFLAVVKEQLFTSLLALAVFRSAETSSQCCLDRT